jgi:hypothetical protein
MGARTWPAQPRFANDAEEAVWNCLLRQLRDDDVMLHGLRLTDPAEGDVEIDILVLMPDCGAAVVEVKGGVLSYAAGEVRQTGADGTHVIDPAEQATRQVRALKRFLERQANWSRGALRAGWLVAMPYTDRTGDLSPELIDSVLLGRNDVPDAAGRVFDRLRHDGLHTPLPAGDWVGAALDHLLGVLDERGEVRARAAERQRHVERLTDQQKALLSVVRNVRRLEVTGAAGTGKTWLAIEQAHRWTEAGERVAFVSYTRGATEAVRRAIDEEPRRGRPRFVGTFFQLGYQWGVHADDADDRDFWERRGPTQMLERAAGLPEPERFTAVVVDEAQDFSDSWWPALLASATPDARIAVFRDDEQAVFAQRRGRPDIELVPLVLDENLRNARQVVDTFRPLISASVVSRAGEGFPVEFVACAPGEEMAAADDVVADLTERRGWLPEHVALLTTLHRHPVQRETDGDRAAYWQSFWDDDAVFYGTVAGFKGLERPAVVLCVDGFHDGLEARHVLYAGMSRARDLLVVVGSPEVLAQAGEERLLRRLTR